MATFKGHFHSFLSIRPSVISPVQSNVDVELWLAPVVQLQLCFLFVCFLVMGFFFLSGVFKKQPCTHFGKLRDVLFINLSHLEVVSNHEEPDKRASRAERQPSSRVPVHVGMHAAPPGRCVCVLLLQQRCCTDTLTLHRH